MEFDSCLVQVRLKINDMQDDGAKVQAPAANAEQAISVYFRPLEVPATIQMGVEVKRMAWKHTL